MKKNELLQEMINKTKDLSNSSISDFHYLNRSQEDKIFKNCWIITKFCNELKHLKETEKSYGNRLKRVFLILYRLNRYLTKQKLHSINQMVEEIRNLLDEFRRRFPPIPINIYLDASNITITLSQQETINRQVFIKQKSSIINLNYEDATSMANWLLENIREYLIKPIYL